MNPTADDRPRTEASPKSLVPDDPRIVAALEAYAAILKAGPRPDRHAFLAQYPDIANDLADCLDGLDFLQTAAPLLYPSVPPSPDASAGELHPEAPLGDYRLVRELGRGGMGIVYEAVQISLGRRVALKVLPFAAALDGKQLQRFKNEAQAASHLHHQNIVPVYGVGCDRGVHHYSMQFIDGQTLSALIHELRQLAGSKAAPHEGQTGPYTPGTADPTVAPTVAAISTERSTRKPKPARFRTVARLGVQAAEALEHAHALGVTHRDIKPANLMLDLRGNLWVTDFGLAHCQNQAGLTMTGDLIGTLRYMSPEQALAKRVLVDHRTDIYSLGATLYELLTLEPPFTGSDRQELLRQIAFEEPRPLRRLNKDIPVELETIVLKAIEKNPNERYASAQELADDLGRYLKDESIRAKRPSLRQRLGKWSRRHKPVVLTAGLAGVGLLLMAIVGLALNNALISGEKKQTEMALQAETEARTELSLALQREQLSSYYQRIGRADLEWWNNNVGRADQILDECLQEYRHWEWRYLKRLCHADAVTLSGHTQPVHGMAFSPDGRRLASASRDKNVKIWDLATGKEILSLVRHSRMVNCVAWSADGRFLASGSGIWDERRPGEAKVWDATTGRELFNLTGQKAFAGVAFSPDGRHLATANWDSTVRVWDLTTGQEVRVLGGHHVRGIAFSRDGQRLASGCHDGYVIVWNAVSGQQECILRGHTATTDTVAFSPDGQRLVSGSWDQTVRVWDLASAKELISPIRRAHIVTGVDFSPDGQSIASACYDGSVKVWQASTGREVATLRGHSGAVTQVAFSPGGRCLASAGWDHTVKVWNLTADQQGTTFVAAARLFRSTLSSDGQRIAMAMRVPDDPERLIPLKIYELTTGREALFFGECGGGFHGAAFSPDGRRLASDWHQTVKIWDANTGQEVFTLVGHTGQVTGVAFSPDSQLLASASADKTVKLWNAKAGKVLLTLAGHTEPVTSVVFSPNGQHLASASMDHTVKIWDANTGRELFTLKGHGAPVTEVAFCRLGKRLASASEDRTVRVWDSQTWERILTLPGHTAAVTAVAFSPDGRRLASASLDGSVRLWDAATGQEALTLRRQFSFVYGVTFTPDGNRLVASGSIHAGEGFKVWGTQPASLDPQAARAEALKADAQNACYLRGNLHSQLRRWDKAIVAYTEAIDRGFSDPPVWRERGTAYAWLAQYENAAKDFARMDWSQPLRNNDAFDYACLFLIRGDIEGHGKFCRQMIQRAGQTKDPYEAYVLTRSFAMARQGPVDPARTVQWGKQAFAGNPTSWNLHILGLAQYRAGQFDQALQCFTMSALGPWRYREINWFAMALAHHQLGHTNEARKALRHGVLWLEREGPKSPDQPGRLAITVWLAGQLLRREAEALLKAK